MRNDGASFQRHPLSSLIACIVVGAAFEATVAYANPNDIRGMLEEVIVSAQRRTEPLHNVPIAITVFSADGLEDFGVSRSVDLQTLIPGMTFTQSLSSSAPFLRGVGSSYSAAGGESPIAFYVDGVYRTSTAGAFFSLHNVESIEVLKGPQGTLFGRNATGGVVSVVTGDPLDEMAAKVSVDYGNYRRTEVGAYLTGPLNESVSASFAANTVDHDGFGRNVVTGSEAFYHRGQVYAAKLQAQLNNTRVRLSVDWSEDRDMNGVALLYLPESVNSITQTALYAGDYNTTGDIDNENINTQYGVSVHVDRDLKRAQFKSITAYRFTGIDVTQDGDRTPLPLTLRKIDTSAKAWTQELQLLSLSDASNDWIVGMFIMDETSAYEFPGTKLITTTQTKISDTRETTRSYALYGQMTIPLTDKTSVTSGLRYTRDRREASDREVFISATGVGSETTDSASATWSEPTWRLAIDHNFTPDVMAYISYNRGFKSGLFNMSPFNALPVNPEKLDAAEIGFKSFLFNRRLSFNVAAYHYSYHHLQVQGNTSIDGATFNILFNAATATISGIEIDSEIGVSEDFRLRIGFSLIDGEYDEIHGVPFSTPNPVAGNDRTPRNLSGLELFRTPKYSFNIGAAYSISSEVGEFGLAISYSHNSEYYFDAAQLTRQEAMSIVNASISWSEPSDSWSLRLWGRNLTDELRFMSANSIPTGDLYSPGEPRTYGIKLIYKF